VSTDGARVKGLELVTRTAVQHADRFIRTGLAYVLDHEPDIEVVGQAASPAELVALCAETRPDAVLLEIDTDAWDAPRLAAALRKRQRTLRCVGVHDAMHPESARRAYQAGIRATVPYSSGANAIISALRGGPVAAPVSTIAARPSTSEPTLTTRESEIIRLIAAGMITREIAEQLDVTVKTVENHKQRIFRKLDVQNQAHAVSIAIRRGLLGSPHSVAHRA
jgi:DNA-binding NarL/FixJ family response regulator